MSNKKRAAGKRLHHHEVHAAENVAAAIDYAAGYKCPDRNARAGLPIVLLDTAATHVRVEHEAGCPWIAGVTR